MTQTALPERGEHCRFRIALDRIHDVTGEAGDEDLGGLLDDSGTQAMQRLLRPQGGNQIVDQGQGSLAVLMTETKRGEDRETRAEFTHGTCTFGETGRDVPVVGLPGERRQQESIERVW